MGASAGVVNEGESTDKDEDADEDEQDVDNDVEEFVDYETQRRMTIRANQEKLRELGLLDIALKAPKKTRKPKAK